MVNYGGHNKTTNVMSCHTVILAALVSVVLISSVFIVNTDSQKAYAAKGGNGGGGKGGGGNSSDKGKSHDNDQSDKSSTAENKDDDRSKDHGGDDNDNSNTEEKSQQKSSEKKNNTNLAKAQKYKPHKLNETIAWEYHANTTYSLDATGTAKAIGKSNSTTNATAGVELSAEMSVWKATKSLVSMDITGGSVTVDGQVMEFYSGQAHYMPSKNKMLLVGFIIESDQTDDNGGTIDNQTTIDTGATNQTSTVTNQTSSEITSTNQTSAETNGNNQTSTEIPSDQETDLDEDSEDKLALRHIKLWIRVAGQDNSFPMTVQVLSPQSKIASEWFLQMNGEMYASP